MNEIIKVEGQTGLTAIGWDLANITEDQWNEAGSLLVRVDQARQWWLGDWWNACAWGDGKDACEALGIRSDSASDCGKVAKSFEMPRRRGNLSFSHHREVTYVEDPTMQDKLLDWAETEKATVKALRAKVQAYMAMADWGESEKERRFDVEAGLTVVANMKEDGDINLINWAKSEGKYVFIGRGQYDLGWGNPYNLPEDGTRDEVCNAHMEYYKFKKSLHAKIDKLKGKVLGCYCYPERCHGDYLSALAKEND